MIRALKWKSFGFDELCSFVMNKTKRRMPGSVDRRMNSSSQAQNEVPEDVTKFPSTYRIPKHQTKFFIKTRCPVCLLTCCYESIIASENFPRSQMSSDVLTSRHEMTCARCTDSLRKLVSGPCLFCQSTLLRFHYGALYSWSAARIRLLCQSTLLRFENKENAKVCVVLKLSSHVFKPSSHALKLSSHASSQVRMHWNQVPMLLSNSSNLRICTARSVVATLRELLFRFCYC